MRFIIATVGVLVLSTVASTQTESRIEGTMANARGPLVGIEVRIRNTSTQEVLVVQTREGGRYSTAIAPGTYDVFASAPASTTFARRQVAVAPGATVRVDGLIVETQNAGTPGELFFQYVAAERTAPTGAAPRTLDGKPDLSGAWLPSADLEPEPTPFQPWADALFKERANHAGEDPRGRCLPTGVVRMHAFDLVKYVQTPALLIMLMEGGIPGSRQVYLDGRSHPEHLEPTWLGHSVGKWEGDTLVVDTKGFNDKGWLDGGRPQTEQLHVIERYRRVDLGHMELEITIDDSGAYTRPWRIRRVLELAQGDDVLEFICENNRMEHYVTH
jgi:carboxypeptidase family protein